MMLSMTPLLLAVLACQAASDVCSGAAMSGSSAVSSKPDPTSSARQAWCQANLTVVNAAIATMNSTNCSNSSTYNVTPVLEPMLAALPMLTAVCGACGDGFFNITNLLPKGDGLPTPEWCQQTLPGLAAAATLANSTTCAPMFASTDGQASLSEVMVNIPKFQSFCNPCLLQMMSVYDQLKAGCKPAVDASSGNVSSSHAGHAALNPLCVSASCSLATPCTATNVAAVVKTAQANSDTTIPIFAQIVQTWLPTFSCASAVTLTGTLALNVTDATSFLSDDKAKSAVAAGIAQFLGVANDSVSVKFPENSGNRRLSERKLQSSSLQVTYSVGVLSANATVITNKLAQAKQSDLATSINAAITASGSQAGTVAVVGLTQPATTTTTTTTTTTGTTVNNTGGKLSSSRRVGPMMSFLLAGMVAFSFTSTGTGKSPF